MKLTNKTLSIAQLLLVAGFILSVTLFTGAQTSHACPNVSPIPLCADSSAEKTKQTILSSLFSFVQADGGGGTYVGTGYHRCGNDRGILWEPPVCYIDPYDFSGVSCPPATPPAPTPPPPPPAPTPPVVVPSSIPTSASSCSTAYFCIDTDTLYYRDAQCTETFIQSCTNGCSQGGCIVGNPPPALPLSVNLIVTPTLIRPDTTVSVSWTSQNADSCTVTGENGDLFTGSSGSRTSSIISNSTLFTLSCTQGVDAEDDSVLVHIVPAWQEF